MAEGEVYKVLTINDLDDIFEQRLLVEPINTTADSYRIQGILLNERYADVAEGSSTTATGYKIGNADLNTFFAGIGTVPRDLVLSISANKDNLNLKTWVDGGADGQLTVPPDLSQVINIFITVESTVTIGSIAQNSPSLRTGIFLGKNISLINLGKIKAHGGSGGQGGIAGSDGLSGQSGGNAIQMDQDLELNNSTALALIYGGGGGGGGGGSARVTFDEDEADSDGGTGGDGGGSQGGPTLGLSGGPIATTGPNSAQGGDGGDGGAEGTTGQAGTDAQHISGTSITGNAGGAGGIGASIKKNGHVLTFVGSQGDILGGIVD